MARWGNLPWDNDRAADWFGELCDKTQIARQVEGTLNLQASESHEEIRAAASVLLFLGRVYVWPIGDLDRHLELAVRRLEEISRLEEVMESPELIDEIRSEIQELRNRLMKPDPAHPPPEPKKCW